MKSITIVLVGQPNVGKSSLMNKICGTHIKVGNFTGVTVEKSEATIIHKGYELKFIDLPGTYSLSEYSFEERLTKLFLENEKYDVILNILDSTNLERCLFLTAQLLEIHSKVCLALNMSDEAKKEGISIDTKCLGKILGVECVSVSAFSGENLPLLLDKIIEVSLQPLKPSKRVYADFVEDEIEKIQNFLAQKQFDEIKSLMRTNNVMFFSLRDVALRLLMQDNAITQALHDKGCWSELSTQVQKSIENIYCQSHDKSMKDIFLNDTLSFAKGAALESMTIKAPKHKNKTQKIDSVLLNKYLGIPIFLFLMWLLFQVTFYLGEFPKVWIEEGIDLFGQWVEETVSNDFLASLLSGGIIAGVGAVLSFLPHILILFFGIVLLEGTGYMSRVAFLLDGFFHKFGLHGKSFIPLVTGFGCSVPAYMSTRMLKNRNDRMLTLFIINFMSCGARLPVYTLFIGAFFTSESAGNILYMIYIFGALVGLCMAKILKLTAFRGDDEPFVMEMPKYRFPSLHLITFSVWQKATSYIKRAGTFILIASVVIWIGTQFPKNEALEEAYFQTIEVLESHISKSENQKEIDLLEEQILQENRLFQSQRIEQSYLGRIGTFIQPIFAPMDFDWKFSVSLLNGLLAKETIISAMGVLYALGDDIDEDNNLPLREVLAQSVSVPTAIAFILFIMFYNPCFAASIIFGKEAGGKRYILYLFIFTSIVSYVFAFLGYKITSLIA